VRPFASVESLSKTYPGARGQAPLCVFDGVSFSIDRGEFVCLIGHSGCGKSTILNIVAGLDLATSGRVLVDGAEVRGPSLDRGG
jgi:nitrate/nitrite transport system ATP-binding protein